MSRISRDLANSPHNHNQHGRADGPNSTSTSHPDHATMQQALRGATTFTCANARVPHVAVVGAGMAGLRCSDVLARSGVNVTLFEARNRLGGRVHQVESGGHLVDMGPNWIHGTKGNPIMTLAEKTKTTVIEPEEDGALFDTGGTRRPDAEAVELSGKIWEFVVDAFKYSDEHSATIDPQTSLFDYFKSRISKMKGVDDRKRQDLLHEGQMWGPFVGDPVETQSLKFFFLEECVDGGNVFVASTYQKILKEAARTATDPDKVDLRLETEIVHFDTSAAAHINPGDGPSHKVTLTTSTGEKLSFDEVVITCPLGWLKRNHTSAFTPALPPRLAEAIEHINYGRLEKLYVTFPEAFWLKSHSEGSPRAISSPTSEDDLNNSNSSSPSEFPYPIFTHFHDPSYVPHPASEPWNQSVVSLAHLLPPHSHPTLLFYIYGPCATHVVHSIKNLEPHSAEYNAVLTAFAKPFYSKLPNYSAANKTCTPTSLLMTQWQNDRLAGNGSYCNFQVGLEKGDEDIEVMRNGGDNSGDRNSINTRGLWFAGEHTSPFIALGTTTGAWWSGEGVARRICAKYGLDVPDDVNENEAGLGQPAETSGQTLQKKDLDGLNSKGVNMAGPGLAF
ncbi:hypothetical protein ABEF92_004743 [Exophiala dermatitidis]|uniref:Flavin containing amine oxidase n=2 Tax=Exophiala dermatitidis TaxID=5970 RepID=H6BPJ1_EXODN|nr:flavin containing amine oxidase [Exophiala dermatitidis NIH/UT8656]EHY53593.1 flavin containing amine oxidase [Exophiala dermatitidis NIH/UT8656]